MATPWFLAWVKRHGTVFGLHSVAESAMLLSWESLFLATGYSAEELNAATDWLAMNAPPKFAREHLAAIQTRIRDVRAVAYRHQTDDQERDRGTCSLCSGTGKVVVPQLRAVHNGEWRPLKVARAGASMYTMATLCKCPLGRWHAAKLRPEQQPMWLEEYEQLNPRWRVQMAHRQRELSAAAALTPAAPRFQSVIDRIIAQLRQPGDEGEG